MQLRGWKGRLQIHLYALSLLPLPPLALSLSLSLSLTSAAYDSNKVLIMRKQHYRKKSGCNAREINFAVNELISSLL